LVRLIEVGEVSDKGLGDEMPSTYEVDWCAPLHDAGVKYRTILAEGPPAPALLSLADAEDASMMVVGSRGRGSSTERLLGSVTQAVAHHARRPVVIVPPGHTSHGADEGARCDGRLGTGASNM